jgi:hypothetical protein
MDKYLFTSVHGQRSILFGYENGFLRELVIEGVITTTEIDFLKNQIPWYEIGLDRFKEITGGRISRIDPDLSFDGFWNSYAYKVGNKLRTEKLWNRLTEPEKAMAMKSIRIYDQFLAMKTNQAKAYPETYLSQRRFENNYKIL